MRTYDELNNLRLATQHFLSVKTGRKGPFILITRLDDEDVVLSNVDERETMLKKLEGTVNEIRARYV